MAKQVAVAGKVFRYVTQCLSLSVFEFEVR
jgi:hypothetical protein